jgi:hypothetical protein
MNPTEAAELLGHAAAFDNRNPSAAAAVAWASALHDVPLDSDAKAAVAAYYTTAPQDPRDKLWILPHHIRTLRTKIRSARLANFQYEPITGETVTEYLARLRGQTQAIASGRIPAPSGRLALEGGPTKTFMQELESRGWEGTRTVEGELTDTVRRAGPLGVECPACHAAIGHPCKTPGGNDRQPLGKPRLTPHSARQRAADGAAETTEADRAAQEQRIRQMSAAHLARQNDIHDAEIVDT